MKVLELCKYLFNFIRNPETINMSGAKAALSVKLYLLTF